MSKSLKVKPDRVRALKTLSIEDVFALPNGQTINLKRAIETVKSLADGGKLQSCEKSTDDYEKLYRINTEILQLLLNNGLVKKSKPPKEFVLVFVYEITEKGRSWLNDAKLFNLQNVESG
jgi:hypothetical protein